MVVWELGFDVAADVETLERQLKAGMTREIRRRKRNLAMREEVYEAGFELGREERNGWCGDGLTGS